MSIDTLAMLGGMVSVGVALAASMWGMFRAQKRDTDRQFEKVDARFDKVDARFEKIEAELVDIRSELSEVKIAIARWEGPRPHFAIATR